MFGIGGLHGEWTVETSQKVSKKMSENAKSDESSTGDMAHHKPTCLMEFVTKNNGVKSKTSY